MTDGKSDKNELLAGEYERVFRLLCEAVDESANIKDWAEYPHSRAFYSRPWTLNDEDQKKAIAHKREHANESFIDLFKLQTPTNIILFIQFTQPLTRGRVE